jgi:hypothetical protein
MSVSSYQANGGQVCIEIESGTSGVLEAIPGDGVSIATKWTLLEQ